MNLKAADIDRATHDQRVAAIQAAVRARPADKKLGIAKSGPSHVVRDRAYKSRAYLIDVDPLCDMLGIDRERLVASVEGTITMGALVDRLLPEGLLPAVTPEFERFTVAGLVNGEGIETSSHRFGSFPSTVSELELVLGDGSCIRASAETHGDLYAAMRECQGTLAVVTAATIRLTRALPYVCSTYRRFDTLDEYTAALTAVLASDEDDFVEGVVLARNCHALITSRFVADPGALPLYRPDEEGAEYYYQHVARQVNEATERRDVIPTRAYLFRAQRGLGWLTETYVGVPLLTETAWGRRWLDRRVSDAYLSSGFDARGISVATRNSFLVNQDLGVTLARFPEVVRWIEDRVGVYPLWNCPTRIPGTSQHLIDVGVYGAPTVPSFRTRMTLGELQELVDYPTLWGPVYLSRAALAAKRHFNLAAHDALRGRYHATDAFPHLYDKITWGAEAAGPPDRAPSPLWRLERDFGDDWRRKPVALLTLAAGAAVVTGWKVFEGFRDAALVRKRNAGR